MSGSDGSKYSSVKKIIMLMKLIVLQHRDALVCKA